MGFGNFSKTVEGMLLGFVGGVIGGVLAYLMFNGIETSTMGSNFAQLAFSFRVTPALLVEGAIFSLLMGLLGGLLPAIPRSTHAYRLKLAATLSYSASGLCL